MTVIVLRVIIRFQLVESIFLNVLSAVHDLPQDPVIRLFQCCRQPHPPLCFLAVSFPALMISYYTKFMWTVLDLKSGKVPNFDGLFPLLKRLFFPLSLVKQSLSILKKKPSLACFKNSSF